MAKILAFLLAFVLWFGFAPTANADVAGLVPCSESPAFQSREFRNTTADPASGQKRKERYSEAYCGPEGLPHLIVDGRISRAGDFIIPSILFLYIAGWIGWVGRAYLRTVREDKNSEMKEIIIDVPLAIKFMLSGFAWPLAALGQLASGDLTAKETEIPVSPR
ncbi:MAG: Photosystem I reaction center subunit III [Oscillatoria sp. PMC 1051.18]|uniref:Photosystem I reaction center subunit III n=1 Tax=Oscillatoria salina TaxID=331517 RepID=UPI0013BB1A56|nr:Photosystem I reaction center subunit III [Oscillatoria salina]MBZ8179940.1 Photosystem I reaction center subunit III [Oscillatoria salina IIICB1]MEC4894546.1 Photosystem I reaction center subunit III [Oscillatoria sp. PMC 1050.18]MEC5029552.1 Photosystem I reaction center subunit III [Oscillatoria sp. PMC 1051.18]NET86835.1 Photosystem I reaction center subunit III [Kamptonema sp. SIO1D9]